MSDRAIIGLVVGICLLGLGGGIAFVMEREARFATSNAPAPAPAPAPTSASAPPHATQPSSMPSAAARAFAALPADGHRVDVLSLVNLDRHIVRGTWQMKDGRLRGGIDAVASDYATIETAVQPHGGYRLHLRFTRVQGQDYIGVVLPVGTARTVLYVAARYRNGFFSGLSGVRGKKPNDDARGVREELQNGRPYELFVNVDVDGDRGSIDAMLDDTPIAKWSGPITELSALGGLRNTPDPTVIALAAGGETEFAQAEYHAAPSVEAKRAGLAISAPALLVPKAESGAVLDGVRTAFPSFLVGDTAPDLIHYIDGASLRRKAGQVTQVEGSRSANVPVGKHGEIWLWGVYEEWPPGDYLIVYRMQAQEPLAGESVCFVDVCTGGRTIAGRRPNADALPEGRWSYIPVSLSLSKSTKIEYRLWTHKHKMALDRIYVFARSPHIPAAFAAAAGPTADKPHVSETPTAPDLSNSGAKPESPSTTPAAPPHPKSIFDFDDDQTN